MTILEVETADGVTVTILELDERQCPPGLALELQWYQRPEGTLALWMLENGRALVRAVVGRWALLARVVDRCLCFGQAASDFVRCLHAVCSIRK